MIGWLILLTACNRAPVDYDYAGAAPGAQGAWTHPTDEECRNEDDPPVIDGFNYCDRESAGGKVAVWDPSFAFCDDLGPDDAASDESVVAINDGVEARAYPLSQLENREAVNDWWSGDPILVDY